MFRSKKESDGQPQRRRSAEDLFYDSGQFIQEADTETGKETSSDPEKNSLASLHSRSSSSFNFIPQGEVVSLGDSPLAQVSNQRWLYRLTYKNKTLLQGTCRWRFHARRRVAFYGWMERRRMEREYKRGRNKAEAIDRLIGLGLSQRAAEQLAFSSALQIKEMGDDMVLITWKGHRLGGFMGSSRMFYSSRDDKSSYWAILWSRKEGGQIACSDGRFLLRRSAKKQVLEDLRAKLLKDAHSPSAGI